MLVNTQNYWPFVYVIHRWLVVSFRKGSKAVSDNISIACVHYFLRPCAIMNIRLKSTWNPNLMQSRLHITYFSGTKSFWTFAQSTGVVLPHFVQKFWATEQLKQMLWTNEISWDLRLIRVSDGYPILHRVTQNTLAARPWVQDILYVFKASLVTNVLFFQ